jgi:hypothetical protein
VVFLGLGTGSKRKVPWPLLSCGEGCTNEVEGLGDKHHVPSDYNISGYPTKVSL